ncbi:MAG: mechanosensitive ion channel family protein [Desulfobacteraceae bacterium]
MSEHYLSIYLLSVGLCGALYIWWSRKRIIRVEDQRKNRVQRLKRFESAETSTPVETPEAEARETAVDSIKSRFSIIRKLHFFLIVSLWVLALIFPFLNKMPATVVSVFVAASGIIIGVAARPFIENLISGIVISFSHPIRIGDTVIIDNNYGVVEDITITHTVVKVWNWRRYIIPNSRMLSKEITNCTINDAYQWTHVEFYVSYDSDISQVKELAVNSKYFADYEDPRFWIMDMEEKGYKCWVAAWADSPVDAWELSNDIRTELIKQFRACGIKTHKLEHGGMARPGDY